jgi:hypothetical protein
VIVVLEAVILNIGVAVAMVLPTPTQTKLAALRASLADDTLLRPTVHLLRPPRTQTWARADQVEACRSGARWLWAITVK